MRPLVKSNKNDHRNAEAIAEVVERENMRVPIKTEDRLDLQAVHLGSADGNCASEV